MAVIGDVVRALLNPSAASAERASATPEQLKEFGREAAYELERLIEDDLAGLIDAPTSPNVTLNKLLTVFDVSALPEDGPALPIVMTIINTWLTNQLMSGKGQQTVFIIEEAWHIVSGSVAEVTRRNLKLQRGVGLMNVMAIHHISDIPPDSPAIAIVKEAGTVFIYGQDRPNDAQACASMFNLPDTAVEALLDMPQGSCLLKIGNKAALMVNHVRSDIEVELTNTDDAMLGIGADDAELDFEEPAAAGEFTVAP